MKKISTLLLCIVLAAALALAATTVGCKAAEQINQTKTKETMT